MSEGRRVGLVAPGQAPQIRTLGPRWPGNSTPQSWDKRGGTGRSSLETLQFSKFKSWSQACSSCCSMQTMKAHTSWYEIIEGIAHCSIGSPLQGGVERPFDEKTKPSPPLTLLCFSSSSFSPCGVNPAKRRQHQPIYTSRMQLFEWCAFSLPPSLPPDTRVCAHKHSCTHLSVLCELVCLCLCAQRLHFTDPGMRSATVKVKDGPPRGWQHLPNAEAPRQRRPPQLVLTVPPVTYLLSVLVLCEQKLMKWHPSAFLFIHSHWKKKYVKISISVIKKRHKRRL